MLKTNTIMLLAALILSGGNVSAQEAVSEGLDQAAQDFEGRLSAEFVTKGIVHPLSNLRCFCHLSRVYRASFDPLASEGTLGDPLNPTLEGNPPYERACTMNKFSAEHVEHGDIASFNYGVMGDASLLNDNGRQLVGPYGNIGIDKMFFDETCQPTDPCTMERMSICIQQRLRACTSGSAECGPPRIDGPGGGFGGGFGSF